MKRKVSISKQQLVMPPNINTELLQSAEVYCPSSYTTKNNPQYAEPLDNDLNHMNLQIQSSGLGHLGTTVNNNTKGGIKLKNQHGSTKKNEFNCLINSGPNKQSYQSSTDNAQQMIGRIYTGKQKAAKVMIKQVDPPSDQQLKISNQVSSTSNNSLFRKVKPSRIKDQYETAQEGFSNT